MGRLQRERESREREQGTHVFTVRQWTAFEWKYPEGKGKAMTERKAEMRKDRTDHLKRAASMIERELRRKCVTLSPTVKQVSVKREPQLLFELAVTAVDKDDALRRARYWLKRGLQTRIPTGNRGPTGRPVRVTLSPPWGKDEVAQAVAARRRRKREEAAA